MNFYKVSLYKQHLVKKQAKIKVIVKTIGKEDQKNIFEI